MAAPGRIRFSGSGTRPAAPPRRWAFPTLAVLALAAVSASAGAAQENDEILARMEYDRMRLYSGGARNLAALLQRAYALKMAMPPNGAGAALRTTTRWRALGPDRVRSGSSWTAGRVSAVAIHPEDSDVIYAGGAQGGVWKSTDAGANWTPLTDEECSLAMGHIAIDLEDPDIIYAGTGEQHFSGDSYYGCGVLRTLDGGETWEQLGADVFVSRNRGGGARIARVVIDRATAGSKDETVVLAASTYGLYRSTDSGEDWNLVLSGTATDVLAHPTADSVFYAAIHSTGVYKSTDTGESWEEASEGMSFDNARRINLAIAPSDPDVLYASFQTGDSEGSGLRMYRTEYGAEEWEKLDAEGASCRFQCWYDMTIAVDPDDPDTVHFGAVAMYRSTDGGETFALHHNGIYVDQHYLVFDTASDPDALYLANDGGVYHTTNGGDSWTSHATNLAVAQYYRGIALHPSDPGVTLGGTQDQGTQRSSAGTRVWRKILGGDGGYTAFDAEDPATWYGEAQWRWGPVRNGVRINTGIDLSEPGLFIPPLVMDPIDSRRLYFGVQSLYRTDNRGDRWNRIYRAPDGRVVSAIGLTPSDANTIYAALTRGQVVVTRDGGSTWDGPGTGLPDRFIGDVAVHPDRPEEAYAVAGGFLTGHVFHTTDGGRSWRDRTGNLPDHPVNAIIYDPADLVGVFIGTDLGVFHSAGGGGDWSRLDDNLPTVAVFDIATQPGTSRLVAATHGRGMFEIPVDVPLTLRTRPASLADTVSKDDSAVITGEVIVAPSGKNDHAASWEATSDASWLTLADAAGEGRGRFRFELSAEELKAGDHTTSIEVALSGIADPLEIPVFFSVYDPLTLPPLRHTLGYGVSAWSATAVDSLPAGLAGTGADTAVWTATAAGSNWITIERASGGADEHVAWSRSSESLAPGDYEDTITIVVEGNPDVTGLIVDRFEVAGPMSVEDVALDYLGADRLTPRQVRFLIWFGNDDELFDIGDVLRWFDHCKAHPADCRGSGGINRDS
ncbi:MAG: hypothetical protein OXU64_04820 [Gemmatimonadota bacterium]|nr:hypothetical protein [Gemmatimonadota bacterium]